MASLIHLDTHVLVWLYTGRRDLLPDAVATRLETSELSISPMAVLELELLHEIGRMSVASARIVETLATDFGVRVCDLPFPMVASRATSQSWTRDPFDRLIVAQAEARGAPLLTRDATILANCESAVWDS